MNVLKEVFKVILVLIAIVMFFPALCKLIGDFWEPLIRVLLGQ